MRRLTFRLILTALICSISALSYAQPGTAIQLNPSTITTTNGAVVIKLSNIGQVGITISNSFTANWLFKVTRVNPDAAQASDWVGLTSLYDEVNKVFVGGASTTGTYSFANTGYTGVEIVANGAVTGTITVTAVIGGGGLVSNSSSSNGTAQLVDGGQVNVNDNTLHAVQVVGTGGGSAKPLAITNYTSGGTEIVPSVAGNDSILTTNVFNQTPSGSTNYVIVNGQANKTIYILGFFLVPNGGTQTITIGYGDTASTCTSVTAVAGPFTVAANSGPNVPNTGVNIKLPVQNRAACVTLASNNQTGGWINTSIQ